MRFDGRQENELRKVTITPNFTDTTGGSCLIECGKTKVLCTAMLDNATMPFLVGTGKGWLTAEYAMLPSATLERRKRETTHPDGRSTEIKRLIGRSLRQAVDYEKLGEHTIWIDCDVLQADGGTRTASITGGYVALALGVKKWLEKGLITQNPLVHQIAAVSVGINSETPILDLCYLEDSKAEVDMNVVMNEEGAFIELQGTGEGRAFNDSELATLISFGKKGIAELMALQNQAINQ